MDRNEWNFAFMGSSFGVQASVDERPDDCDEPSSRAVIVRKRLQVWSVSAGMERWNDSSDRESAGETGETVLDEGLVAPALEGRRPSTRKGARSPCEPTGVLAYREAVASSGPSQ
jgi:hypothetical protein